jgi:integrase
MPYPGKGARTWFQKPRRDRNGKLIERGVWCIRDGPVKRRLGFGEGTRHDAPELQDALADYIRDKRKIPRDRDRHPSQVIIADVISIYAEDVAPKDARPKEVAARLGKLLDFVGDPKHRCQRLDQLNAKTCAAYVQWRGAPAAARRELEDLRAAVRHHWKAGLCIAETPVVLPERGEPRATWLRRGQAARLLLAAYRYREVQKGFATGRRALVHIARFSLVALYTGTRAGAICNAALEPTEGRGWVDLGTAPDCTDGVFYRRPAGRRETKKRQTPIRIPPRLCWHLRRWKRLGISKHYVVEFNGKPVKRINKGFRSARRLAGLGTDVTPHTFRHTCATWMAQRRVPIHEICGFLGMTRETFERVYGHHHPDFQAEAVNAFSKRPGQLPDSLAATKRERTASKVVNLHGKR